jgi:hypothetical protein
LTVRVEAGRIWRGRAVGTGLVMGMVDGTPAAVPMKAAIAARAAKGRLVPGRADIAMFDNGLLESPLHVVKSETRCVPTLLVGEAVHDAR